MVVISLSLHIAAIGIFHFYRFRTDDNHFGFGWEMGRIGQSIALGQGFSNPYGGFDRTDRVGAATLSISDRRSVQAVWNLFHGLRVGVAVLQQPANGINLHSDLSDCAKNHGRESRHLVRLDLGPASLCHVLVRSLGVGYDAGAAIAEPDFSGDAGTGRLQRVEGMGVVRRALGIGELSNPSMLSFLPFSGLWIWHRRRQRGLPSIAGVALASALFFVCLTPWLARNYRTFGRFVFVRNDFGLQLRSGERALRRRQADGLSSAQPERCGVGKVPPPGGTGLRGRDVSAWLSNGSVSIRAALRSSVSSGSCTTGRASRKKPAAPYLLTSAIPCSWRRPFWRFGDWPERCEKRCLGPVVSASDADLSHNLLFCFPARALSASD